jgi:hypothetical protein
VRLAADGLAVAILYVANCGEADAWTAPDAPRPAPYPDQLRLVTRSRNGNPRGLDRANHWAGQSAALATTDPAGEIVARMWRDAQTLADHGKGNG